MLANLVNDPDVPPDPEPDLTAALLALEVDTVNVCTVLMRLAGHCPACQTEMCEHAQAAGRALAELEPLARLSVDLTLARAREEVIDFPW